MASLLTANIVCANDAYKNNVVDVRVNKENGNAVKVTIYTDKPYTEPVVVNKKANNKYVILMPETSNSLKGAPSVTGVAGTVSNVSVNTQAVSGGKGYTKIVITSDKAITVVPRTQQMTTSKPAEQKPAVATKPAAQKPAVQTPTAQQLAQKKAKQEAEKKAKAEKLKQENIKKQQLAQQKAKREAERLAQQKAKQEAQRLAQQKAKQEAQKKAQAEKLAQQAKPAVEKQKPIEVLEKEIETGNYANLNNHETDDILNKEIKENTDDVSPKTEKETNKSVIENIKAVLKDFQRIGLWKLLLLAGAITLPVIVIMLILALDKKINRKIDKSFKKEEDDVQIQETKTPQDVQPQVYNSFDEMLNQVEEPTPSYHEEQLHRAEYEEFKQSVNEPIVDIPEQPESDFVDTDFENDINSDLVNAVEDVQQVQQPEYVEPEIVEAEVEEQDFAAPEPVVEETPRPLEPFNSDSYLADFSEVNDAEFFDELAMQALADGNANGLPEQSPADAIFDFMDDNIPEQEQASDFESEETVFQSADEDAGVNTGVDTDEVPAEDTPVEEDTHDEENLTMLTEVKISDTKGMYLVNYDNFSSLVGHINDDYFVIKKFDDIVNSRIILKETEKLKDATRYLVRVGRNKMVVEVSETSMNRLLDL